MSTLAPCSEELERFMFEYQATRCVQQIIDRRPVTH